VEHIKSESYLGLKVYRFYGRCRHCWAEFTFKTDPKNSDYTMESGGKRTYEAWKDADAMEAQMKAEKEKDAELDQMKALEQKSIDVQAEMERLEDLDAIRSMNKRLGAREQTIEEALQFIFEREQKRSEQEEEVPEGDLAEMAGFREAQEAKRSDEGRTVRGRFRGGGAAGAGVPSRCSTSALIQSWSRMSMVPSCVVLQQLMVATIASKDSWVAISFISMCPILSKSTRNLAVVGTMPAKCVLLRRLLA